MRNKKSKFAELFQEYPDVVSVPQLCKMWGCAKGTHISFCIPDKSNICELGRYTAFQDSVSLIFWKRKTTLSNRLKLPALKFFKGCRISRHP